MTETTNPRLQDEATEPGAMTFPRWFIMIAGGLISWAGWVSYALININTQLGGAMKAADAVQILNVQQITEASKRERLEDRLAAATKEIDDKMVRMEASLVKLQK